MRTRHIMASATLASLLACTSTGLPADDSGAAPLKTVADIPLPGAAVRFDYQSFDRTHGRLYMAHMNAVFRENGKALVNVGSQSMPHAHTVSVDPDTHLVFFPLQNLNGKPVLRLKQPSHVHRRVQ
jgi:hypothetical protein